MGSRGYLFARNYPINDLISITIPTVGEIWDNEDEYNGLLTSVIASPTDFMVQLDDIGIDFCEISPFELFVLLFDGLKEMDTHLVFGDLDLKTFERSINTQNNQLILLSKETGAIIDRCIHDKIRKVLREINHLEITDKKAGNAAAKKYMIERARIKQKRAARRPKKSNMEDLVIAMVNTEQYKYDFEGTRNLTIYQFNASVQQVIKKINYDHLMAGCYAGTVDMKDIDQSKLNWLSSG